MEEKQKQSGVIQLRYGKLHSAIKKLKFSPHYQLLEEVDEFIWSSRDSPFTTKAIDWSLIRGLLEMQADGGLSF